MRAGRPRDMKIVMKKRSLISMTDLTVGDIDKIVARSVALSEGAQGKVNSATDASIGVLFNITSTRTRTSFVVGAQLLGASCIQYGPGDLQLNTGESMSDTIAVLNGYLDVLVVRDKLESTQLRDIANEGCLAVVNAMSFDEHPTQALADLAAMNKHFGSLVGKKILYVGEGNSTANALALAVSRLPGVKLYVGTPAGFGIPRPIMNQVKIWCAEYGGKVVEDHGLTNFPEKQMDVVYATRWQTTGTEKPDPQWRQKFQPFYVDSALIDRFSHPERGVFMHDLPAHRGEDVSAEVLDGPNSIAFMQAHQKLFTSMAVLEWCMHKI